MIPQTARPKTVPEPTIAEVNAIRMQGGFMDAAKLAALLENDSLRDAFTAHSSNESFLIGLEIGMRVQAARQIGVNDLDHRRGKNLVTELLKGQAHAAAE